MPNRFKFGYGLTPEIVELASEKKPDLIITVDNGIASIEGVSNAREKGIDVLITDHHLPADILPDASRLINRSGDAHRSLCSSPQDTNAAKGAGVAHLSRRYKVNGSSVSGSCVIARAVMFA